MEENQSLVQQILRGKLPTVKMEIGLTRESLVDAGATAVIVVIICVLINKFIINRL